MKCPVCDEPYQQGDLLCLSCGANLARSGGARRQGAGYPPPQQGSPQYPYQQPYEQAPYDQGQPQHQAPPPYQQDPGQYQQGPGGHPQHQAPPPYQQTPQHQAPPQDPWAQQQQQGAEAWNPPVQAPAPPQHQAPQHQAPPQDPWAQQQQQGPGGGGQQMDSPWGQATPPPMPEQHWGPPQQQAPPAHEPHQQHGPGPQPHAPADNPYAPADNPYAPADNPYAPPSHQPESRAPMPPTYGREATLVPPEAHQQRSPQGRPDSTALMCPYCEAVLSNPGAAQCDSCLRPLPSSQSSPVLRVQFPSGEIKVTVGQHLVLGRDAGQSPVASTFTQYDNVSRRHSTVWLDPSGTAWVRDEGSTNGTFVNGERLPRGVEAPLRDGDQLRLAADVTGTVSLK
ncbi:FHA domain-containing protein [Actinomadura rubrobrunea]|uniref:FHA domain-containing protein n=1 Tax=Actinomadura rubrobrunea TaxID=115335 RepID=UPI0011B21059|nr:FHA domain-containing protein [Actinomadura rubrobrunea]